jgi:hypothetical protein
MAEKYPWCSIAQLFLLQHYKKTNSAQFDRQATKTALYFNNHDWLSWQLNLLTQHEKNEVEPEKMLEINSEKDSNADKSSDEYSEIEPTPLKIPAVIAESDEKKREIQQSLSQISSDESIIEDSIAFEPLHTVDYFASQGIRITDDPITNDKLGNQMKSFTEWLKSMKRIHKENPPLADEQTDKNIQQIAEHSNADADVVTEAMANVLINQNKTEKAIEVYEKLSLLNPSKSAYFAAQIDSLKKY